MVQIFSQKRFGYIYTLYYYPTPMALGSSLYTCLKNNDFVRNTKTCCEPHTQSKGRATKMPTALRTTQVCMYANPGTHVPCHRKPMFHVMFHTLRHRTWACKHGNYVALKACQASWWLCLGGGVHNSDNDPCLCMHEILGVNIHV